MARLPACVFQRTVVACLMACTVVAWHVVWTTGIASEGFAQEVRQVQEPPATTLPLRLVGVAVDPESPANSACLVQCTYTDGKLARFRAGERPCELAQVNEIRSDSVLITNLLTNRSELLAFADATTPASGAPPPSAPSVTTSSDTVAVGLAKGSVDYYLGNLSDILAAATATPKFKDGTNGSVIEGFELSKIKEGSIVEQLGLQNGDVLLDVNGQPLDGLPTVLRLLSQVQSTPRLRMTVSRNGQRLTFVLNSK